MEAEREWIFRLLEERPDLTGGRLRDALAAEGLVFEGPHGSPLRQAPQPPARQAPRPTPPQLRRKGVGQAGRIRQAVTHSLIVRKHIFCYIFTHEDHHRCQ